MLSISKRFFCLTIGLILGGCFGGPIENLASQDAMDEVAKAEQTYLMPGAAEGTGGHSLRWCSCHSSDSSLVLRRLLLQRRFGNARARN